ncbi:hypothetical protein BDQ17DRAFT_1539777 [Cyathus striatus]|nr:hypothetical protein BDQ17DRAFT_1539777 [Cyathus striatus]
MISLYFLLHLMFHETSFQSTYAFPINNTSSSSSLSSLVILSSLSSTSNDSTSVRNNCNQRSILEIVWNCLGTLFLCTWVAVHPNIPDPNENDRSILLRRLNMMYWTIIAPELVFAYAVRQFIGAKYIFNKYKAFDRKWTMKHAYFLQMGGFYTHSQDKHRVISQDRLDNLLKENRKFPDIKEAEIQDKSKADGPTKILLITQTLWFVIQCIGRYIQGYALAPLEVTTLAVTTCTFMLSIIWWHKPFDVRHPIYLDIVNGTNLRDALADRRVTSTIFFEDDGVHQETSSNEGNSNKLDISESREDQPIHLEADIPQSPIEIHEFDITEFAQQVLYRPQECNASDTGTGKLCRDGVFQEDDRVRLANLGELQRTQCESNDSINEYRGVTPLEFEDYEVYNSNIRQENWDRDRQANMKLEIYLRIAYGPPGIQQVIRKYTRLALSYWTRMYWKVVEQIKQFARFCTVTALSCFMQMKPVPKRLLKHIIAFMRGDHQMVLKICELLIMRQAFQCLLYSVDAHWESLFDADELFGDPKRRFFSGFTISVPFAAIFGLIHCIAWNAHFPSTVERFLWRISSISVSVALIISAGMWKLISLGHARPLPTIVFFRIPLIIYAVARYYLLIEAIIAFRALPPSALQSMDWSNFLPHI